MRKYCGYCGADIEKQADLLSLFQSIPQMLTMLGIRDPRDVIELVRLIKELLQAAPYLKAKFLAVVKKLRSKNKKEIDASSLFRQIDISKVKKPSDFKVFLDSLSRALDTI
jgi:hypothetical protein